MLLPMGVMGQAAGNSSLSSWMEMHTLMQGGGNSVFHPLLGHHDGDDARRGYWLAAGNAYTIGGLQKMEAGVNSNTGNGALGMVLSAGGGGPLDHAGLAGQYSQLLSPQLRMGLSLGGCIEKWRGYGAFNRWDAVLKAIFRINELTAFSVRFGWNGNTRNKSLLLRKTWVTEMGRSVYDGLYVSARLEQSDNQDLQLQIMGDWKMNKNLGLMGGINISNGTLMIGFHQSGKKNRKGGCINSHPMLGAGLEIFFSHVIE